MLAVVFAASARDCYVLWSDEQNMQNPHEYSVYLCIRCLHVLPTWHLIRYLNEALD